MLIEVCPFSPLLMCGAENLHAILCFDLFPFQITAMPSTHKKDKPWDTDDIDKWKVSLIESISQPWVCPLTQFY